MQQLKIQDLTILLDMKAKMDCLLNNLFLVFVVFYLKIIYN